MKHLIEHFDSAYIINLVDRPDRRQQAVREFRRVGVNAENGKVQFYTAVRPTDPGPFHSIGVKGSFTSHRSVLELASREGLQNVLVFEDDVSFRSAPANLADAIVAQLLAQDWDLVFFGYLKPNAETVHQMRAKQHDELPLMPWRHDVIGGHFYGVNGKFIQIMLQYMYDCEGRPRDHHLGGPMSADGAHNHIRYLRPDTKAFIVVPNLAYQRCERTDIWDDKAFDRIVWLRPMVSRLRAVKHWARMALDAHKMPNASN